MTRLELIHNYLSKNEHAHYFKHKQVVMWIFGDLSFIDGKTNNDKKIAEDNWGRELTNKKKDWSGPFGEKLVNEFFNICGVSSKRPNVIDGYRLDLETDHVINEIKTQTYFTTGTACEKIPGVAFKYAEVPRIYNKPLTIITIAGAERECCKNGIFPVKGRSPEKEQMIQDYKNKYNIKYEKFTDMIESYVNTQLTKGCPPSAGSGLTNIEPELPLSSHLDSLSLSDDDTQQV